MTFIDTADIYSRGASEELDRQGNHGPAQRGRRWPPKCARRMGEGPYSSGLSRRWMVRAVEDSLKPPGHGLHRSVPGACPRRRDADRGNAARHGRSGSPGQGALHRLLELPRLARWRTRLGISQREGLTPWISVQPRWNVIDGLDDPDLLPACSTLGVGMIPYTPLASGILTGKYRPGRTRRQVPASATCRSCARA